MDPGVPVMLEGRSGRSPGNSSSHNKIKGEHTNLHLSSPPQRSKIPKMMFFSRTPITICNFTGCALNSFPSSYKGDWEPLEAQIRPEHAGGAKNLCWASLTLVGEHLGEQKPRKSPANASPWVPDTTFGELCTSYPGTSPLERRGWLLCPAHCLRRLILHL